MEGNFRKWHFVIKVHHSSCTVCHQSAPYFCYFNHWHGGWGKNQSQVRLFMHKIILTSNWFRIVLIITHDSLTGLSFIPQSLHRDESIYLTQTVSYVKLRQAIQTYDDIGYYYRWIYLPDCSGTLTQTHSYTDWVTHSVDVLTYRITYRITYRSPFDYLILASTRL